MLVILLKIVFAYFFSDFLMGVFHWIKDTYFSPYTPVIGKKFIWGSRLHHIRPRYVTEFSNWQLIKDSALWSLIWFIPLFLFVGFSYFWFTIFILISLNEVIHKYAHMSDSEKPFFITLLQKIMLIQSPELHHLHHDGIKNDTNYCPITAFLNPFLEYFNFWKTMEKIIYKLSGIEPRSNECDYVEDENYPGGIVFVKK
jgi:sterol desaturase/sphingolipid hydroxylase (fatty acid hydroxylase superfamily)